MARMSYRKFLIIWLYSYIVVSIFGTILLIKEYPDLLFYNLIADITIISLTVLEIRREKDGPNRGKND